MSTPYSKNKQKLCYVKYALAQILRDTVVRMCQNYNLPFVSCKGVKGVGMYYHICCGAQHDPNETHLVFDVMALSFLNHPSWTQTDIFQRD